MVAQICKATCQPQVITVPRRGVTGAGVQQPRFEPLQRSTRVCSTRVPDRTEDKDAAHSAWMSAFEKSKPTMIKVDGLQEYASAIWERRRRIPSQLYNDPLNHLFHEFDEDGDGHLSAEEISHALKSRNVKITPDQVQLFINIADSDGNKMIEQNEFADLIFHMASADLNRDHHAPIPNSEDEQP